MEATVKTFTEAQATDEAVLLFTRKMRRLSNADFNRVWAMLPDGAKDALLEAERRADRVRDRGEGLTWAVEAEIDEDGEE